MNGLITFLLLPTLLGFSQPAMNNTQPASQQLSYREFSLNNRYSNSFVNDVFKDNILLAVDYATGDKVNPAEIDWNEVEKPFTEKITLKPGETFAFHDDVLPQYQGKISKTTNAHFNGAEGFKSDGYLMGDGVCHLASLLYWAAKDAGLDTLAPVRHDFAAIPDVPSEFGTSIYSTGGKDYTGQMQNLYITNNKKNEVNIVFKYDGNKLGIKIEEVK